MSNSKFTPGPWAYGVRDDGSIWLSLGEPLKGLHMQGDLVSTEADAKLITAAPALYAALERISRPHDCGCAPCTGSCTSEMALQITVEEMRQLAGDAIQKATA